MLLKHTFIYFIARGIPGVAGFLSILIFTRNLSPEQYGNYAYVLIGVNLLNAVVYQWLRLGLVRYLPTYTNDEIERQRFLNTVLTSFILLMGITFTITLVFVVVWKFELEFAIYCFIGLLLLWSTAWFELTLSVLRSMLKPIKFGIVSIVKAFSGLLLGVVLVLLGFGEVGLLTGLAFGTAIGFSLAIKDWGRLKFTIDRELIKFLIAYGMPLTATFGMTYVMQTSDRMLIGWLDSTKAAGIYSVSADFAQQSIALLMMVVNLSAFPLVVNKLEKEGEAAAKNQLKYNIILLLFVSIPAVLGIVILAPNIVSVLFGSEFREETMRILPLIIIGIFLQGLKAYYTDLSFQLGKTTLLQIVPVLTGIAVNITLNLWFIPTWGLVGAAYSSIISYALSFLINWRIGQRVFALPVPFLEIGKLGVASITMAVYLLFISDLKGWIYLIIQIISGVIIYSVVLYCLNLLSVKELLKAMLQKQKKRKTIEIL